MRKWINLLEDSFVDAVKSMAPHDSTVDAGYGYDIDGNGYEITDDHVLEMRAKIEIFLKRNPTIYRFILLRPVDLAKYLSGPLGVYWCHEHEDVPLDALTGWNTAPKDAELYRLTATIDLTDVDMVRTVLQNLAVPWESEIKVNQGARLRLIAVDLLPNSDQHAHAVKQSFPQGPHAA